MSREKEVVEYNPKTHTIKKHTNIFGDELISITKNKRHCSCCSREFKPWNRFYLIDYAEPTIRRKKVVTSKDQVVVCKNCTDPDYRAFVKEIQSY